MDRMVFINLPVSDLQKSTDFYTGLGFTLNPDFSSPEASSMVISDTIVVMLLNQEHFSRFLRDGNTPHLGSDAKEVLVALSADSNEEVDQFLANAQSGGGSIYRPAESEMPGMYGAAIADPDGHVWEIMHMSPEGMAAAAEENAAATQGAQG